MYVQKWWPSDIKGLSIKLLQSIISKFCFKTIDASYLKKFIFSLQDNQCKSYKLFPQKIKHFLDFSQSTVSLVHMYIGSMLSTFLYFLSTLYRCLARSFFGEFTLGLMSILHALLHVSSFLPNATIQEPHQPSHFQQFSQQPNNCFQLD